MTAWIDSNNTTKEDNMTTSTLTIKRKEQPIESVTISRKGFQDVVVDRATSGKLRVAVNKEGVQAFLFDNDSAANLAEAIETMLAA